MHCFLNGSIGPLAEAKIPVTDRGFLYGETLFETMRAAYGTIPLWEHHASRLFASAIRLGFAIPYTAPELIGHCRAVIQANALHQGVVRLTVSRGQSARGIDPKGAYMPTVLITMSELPANLHEKSREGYRIGISQWRKPSHRTIPTFAKTGNYLNSVLAFQSAGEGLDEAILFDEDNFLAEGSFSNVFSVRDGRLRTPALPRCLPGVGRKLVLTCAAQIGMDVEEADMRMEDLLQADEIFLTNAVRGIMPVMQLDGRSLPARGTRTKALEAAWTRHVGWPA